MSEAKADAIVDAVEVAVLNTLRDEAHRNAAEHGWWEREDKLAAMPDAIAILGPDWYLPEKIALMHSEESEALEEYRNGKDPTEVYFSDKGKPEGIPIEFADVIIRILDVCGRRGIDIGEAVRLKMEYNKSRPYRHGNKLA